MNEQKLRLIFLTAGTAVALYFCYLITAPFLKPILFAAVLAMVSYPTHKHVQRYVKNTNAAALLSLLLIILLVVVPVLFLSQALGREAKASYQLLTQQMAQSGSWSLYLAQLAEQVTHWLQRFIDIPPDFLCASVMSRLEQFSSLLVGKVAGFFSDLGSFIVQTVIMFFALYFFLRDGGKMWRWGTGFLPLKAEQAQKLTDSVYATIIASVYGVLAVGFAQGLLLSFAFYVLGLPSPLLWGVVTAFFSLVPLVGSAAIWLPAAIILLLSGNWVKGLLLLAWGAGIVAMADNVIRPIVLSETTKSHGLQTFIALMGGLQAFGLIGLFVGPVVLAVTKALFQILREENLQWRDEPS